MRGRTSLALDGPQLLPKLGDRHERGGRIPHRGGDLRTFREALHFLAVKIKVGRIAFLPDINTTRSNLKSLGLVKTARNEREDVKCHGVEEDIGVSGRTDADTSARRTLHAKSPEDREGRTRGRGGGGGVEIQNDLGTGRAEGFLMVRDYIYGFSSHRSSWRVNCENT